MIIITSIEYTHTIKEEKTKHRYKATLKFSAKELYGELYLPVRIEGEGKPDMGKALKKAKKTLKKMGYETHE